MRNPLHPALIVILFTLGVVASEARSAKPDDLRARAAELRKEVPELTALGRVDEATKLQREADELDTTADKMQAKIQKAAAKPATDKVVKTPPGKLPMARHPLQKKYADAPDAGVKPEEVAGRVQHLRTAAEHLKAAGKTDLSSKIWAEADLLEQTTKPAKVAIKKGSSDASDRTSDIAAELRALQLEVQRLKAELAAMRKPSK